jgi:hypothetical protein
MLEKKIVADVNREKMRTADNEAADIECGRLDTQEKRKILQTSVGYLATCRTSSLSQVFTSFFQVGGST